MKTFIRRPGNKTKHLKHIIPMIPEFKGTYIEPFLGTGAVYLHLLPEKAILNDLNTDIMNIWRLVQSDPGYIIKQIDQFKKKFLPLSNEEKLKLCKKIVSKMDSFKGKKKTVMYLLMVYCSFNAIIDKRFPSLVTTIYSKNQSHIFTEDYKTKILTLSNILKTIRIENKDYSIILEQTEPDDFVFLDPPYIEQKKYDFQYNKNENFSIYNLKNELDELTKRKVKWLMTQIDTVQVREIFKKYNIKSYTNNYSIKNSLSSKKELIITNY